MDALPITNWAVTAIHGYGNRASHSILQLQCQEQNGKFYVSQKTLNASTTGAGNTAEIALSDYMEKCGASSYKVVPASSREKDRLTVYHGTGTAIEKFDYAFANVGNDALGSGFYFTTDMTQAEQYALRRLAPELEKPGGEQTPNVVSAWLDIKNPMHRSTTDQTLTRANVMKILQGSPCLNETLENFGDLKHEGFKKVFNIAVGHYVSRPGHDKELLGVLFALANDFYPEYVQAFNKTIHEVLGYDGVIDKFEDGITHYVAFFPEQIHITASTSVNVESIKNKFEQSIAQNDISSEAPVG